MPSVLHEKLNMTMRDLHVPIATCPAGVHMALILEKAGDENVVVLERLGDKNLAESLLVFHEKKL